MKPKRNYLFFLFIIIIIAINGCSDDDCKNCIPLDYSKCPCDHEAKFLNTVQKDNVLMFDASKTSIEQMEKLSLNNKEYMYILINKEHNITSTCKISSFNGGISDICNFPAYLMNIDIPSTGIIVSFEGDEFEKCNPKHTTGFIDSDLVLTSIKINV